MRLIDTEHFLRVLDETVQDNEVFQKIDKPDELREWI